MKKILFLTFLITTIGYSAELELSLDDVIHKAYKNNYDLKNSKLDSSNANYRVKKSYKDLLPKADYSLETTRYEYERRIGSDDVDSYYKNTVKVTQPLFQGGALIAGLNSAKESRKKYDLLYKDQEIKTKIDAIDKYINVLISNEELKVYNKSLESLQKEYDKINRKFQLDMVPKTALLPLNTRILNLKTNVVQAENSIAISNVDLKNFVGIHSQDTIVLSPLNPENYNLSHINLEADVAYIRKNNRNIKIKEAEKKIKESEKTIARSEFLPKVNAVYKQSSGDNRFSKSNDDYTWEAGIVVDVNVFQFGKSIDEYKIRSNEVEKAENQESKAKNDIELQLRKSYLDLVKFKGIVQAQESAVLSARENFNIESRRFEMDLTDSISFIKIEENLVESELSLLMARYNFFLAYSQYQALLQ